MAMFSRVIRKRELQVTIRSLKKLESMNVERATGRYKVTHLPTDTLVLEALVGPQAYLVRFSDEWFDRDHGKGGN
jgi:hypothetical protein